MKLTKLQQATIRQMISESLSEVLDEADVGTDGMKDRVNDDVIRKTVTTSAVTAQIQEVTEDAVGMMYGKLPELINHILQSNGLSDVDASTINDIVTHSPQLADMQQHFVEQLVDMFEEHVGDATQIVLGDFEEESF